VANRRIIDYPKENPTSIQSRYDGETLLVHLPDDVDATNIKWLTLWCDVFDISFGDVTFPDLVAANDS